jgi:NADH-quinone oxidoreductase subunit L
LLFIGAGLTAFYMFRLYYRIFWYESDKHYHHKPHEAGAVMTIPLIILALFSIFSGLVPFNHFISADRLPFEAHIDMAVASCSVAIAVIGIVIAYLMYRKKNESPDSFVSKIGLFYKWAFHKFYFDELWLFVTKKVIFNNISRPIAWFDRHIVDGFMNGLAFVTQGASEKIKGLQSGRIQQYAIAYLIGALVLISIFAFCFICFICK